MPSPGIQVVELEHTIELTDRVWFPGAKLGKGAKALYEGVLHMRQALVLVQESRQTGEVEVEPETLPACVQVHQAAGARIAAVFTPERRGLPQATGDPGKVRDDKAKLGDREPQAVGRLG